MISKQQQEQASLYALGTLSGAERSAFEAEMRGNVELGVLVKQLQQTTDLMALSVPSVPLPSTLRDRVLKKIDQSAAQSPVMSALAGLRFMDAAAERGWKALPVPGAYIKLLSIETDRGYAVLLGKLEPGVRYPAHINAGPEDFYVLTGDLNIGNRRLVAGDFHHADRGSQHEVNYSEEGCTLLAVLTTDDPLVQFAMS